MAKPTKLLRVATMCQELLSELRTATLDDRGRARFAETYVRLVDQLKDTLSDDLRRELDTVTVPFREAPTQGELRVAQAQLVGWLEGLFQGIQAALWAQHVDAQAQLEELLARRQLPGLAPAERPGRESGQYL